MPMVKAPTARHLLALHDLEPSAVERLVLRAAALKTARRAAAELPLRGRTLGLVFEKSSTRTRISFEAAMAQLGGTSLFISVQDLQLKRGESVADTARVLSRYLDAIVIRTFGHDALEEWAGHATIPVINGLTDMHHPCQGLGDLLTLRERFGALKGLALAYIGDGNNVAHSLIEGAAAVGMTIRLACPKGYEPDAAIVAAARRTAAATGGAITIGRDPAAAADGADALYTDVWVSMGQERETARRKRAFKGYQINAALLARAQPSAIVLHCLPAYRGLEITADALDGPQSAVLDQAENRMHVQKAVLEMLIR